MKTSILVLTIIGAALSLIVGLGSGACIQGIGEMNRHVGNISEANDAQSFGGMLTLFGLLQCGVGGFGGLKAYQLFGTKKSMMWGIVPLVIAGLFSISNTCSFFTAGMLFFVAALLAFLGMRQTKLNAVPADITLANDQINKGGNGLPPTTENDEFSIGNRLKSAGQLAARQAQRTKIVTITLPTAYKVLGRHVYGAKKFSDEFPEHYQEFARLSDEMKAIKSDANARPAAEGIAAKTKAAASAVKDMAQSKTIEVKVSQAFGKFGEAVYVRHGAECGPVEAVQPIADALTQLANLDGEILKLSSSKSGQILTPKRIAIGGVCLIALIFLGVIGKMSSHDGPSGSIGHDGGSDIKTDTPSAVQIDAAHLVIAFKENEVAANAKYKGKRLQIDGIVEDVKDIFGASHVYLSNQSSMELRRVDCNFNSSSNSDLATLRKGSYVTILGDCNGMFGNINIENCSLVKN